MQHSAFEQDLSLTLALNDFMALFILWLLRTLVVKLCVSENGCVRVCVWVSREREREIGFKIGLMALERVELVE